MVRVLSAIERGKGNIATEEFESTLNEFSSASLLLPPRYLPPLSCPLSLLFLPSFHLSQSAKRARFWARAPPFPCEPLLSVFGPKRDGGKRVDSSGRGETGSKDVAYSSLLSSPLSPAPRSRDSEQALPLLCSLINAIAWILAQGRVTVGLIAPGRGL